MNAGIAIETLQEAHVKYWEDEAKKRNEALKNPMSGNRASQMGACTRKIVFMRTAADESLPWYTPGLLQIFHDGDIHEQALEWDFEKLGFKVHKQQKSISDHPDFKKVNITGSSDWTILDTNSNELLAECKSLRDSNFEKIETWQDFNSSHYMKKYPAQGQLYMHGTFQQAMVFILKDKNNATIKFIPMDYDAEVVKGLIEKAALINNHISEKTLPDPQPWDEECQNCSFQHVCLNDMKGEGKTISFDEQESSIVAILNEMKELKASHKRYESLNELKKGYFKAKLEGELEKLLFLPGFEVRIKSYNMPEKVVKAHTQVRSFIKETGGK